MLTRCAGQRGTPRKPQPQEQGLARSTEEKLCKQGWTGTQSRSQENHEPRTGKHQGTARAKDQNPRRRPKGRKGVPARATNKNQNPLNELAQGTALAYRVFLLHGPLLDFLLDLLADYCRSFFFVLFLVSFVLCTLSAFRNPMCNFTCLLLSFVLLPIFPFDTSLVANPFWLCLVRCVGNASKLKSFRRKCSLGGREGEGKGGTNEPDWVTDGPNNRQIRTDEAANRQGQTDETTANRRSFDKTDVPTSRPPDEANQRMDEANRSQATNRRSQPTN